MERGLKILSLGFPQYLAPPTSEEEEEKGETTNLVHNFGARKRKLGVSFKQATSTAPEVVGEAEQHQHTKVRLCRR